MKKLLEKLEEEKAKMKLCELILHICEKSINDPQFNMKKLKEIIFQVDRLAYLRTGKTITGSAYVKE